jgi:hypothetical protein
MANTHLTIMFSDLDARLRNIEANIRRRRIPDLEVRLERCNAMLSNILDLVRFQAADLSPYYSKLTYIRARLLNALDVLEDRRNVWWRRLLRPITLAIDVVIILLGYPPSSGVHFRRPMIDESSKRDSHAVCEILDFGVDLGVGWLERDRILV